MNNTKRRSVHPEIEESRRRMDEFEVAVSSSGHSLGTVKEISAEDIIHRRPLPKEIVHLKTGAERSRAFERLGLMLNGQ